MQRRAKRPTTDRRRATVSPGRFGMRVTSTPGQCMFYIFLLAWSAKLMCNTTWWSWQSEII